MMKCVYLVVLLLTALLWQSKVLAQNETNGPAVVRVDNSTRADESASAVIVADGFSYYTTQQGIYLIFPKTNNNVKLVALTGQLIWSGELVSGRFYIPTGRGIYFLRVNNKSYKVSCK